MPGGNTIKSTLQPSPPPPPTAPTVPTVPTAPYIPNIIPFPFTGSAKVGNLSQGDYLMGSAICNNKFYFAHRDDTNSLVIDVFDPSTNSTASMKRVNSGRYGIAVAAVGKKVLFAGGRLDAGANPVSRVDIYDVTTETWSTAALSIPRYWMAVGVLGNKAFFAGGSVNTFLSNTVYKINF
jgi:Kelch motif